MSQNDFKYCIEFYKDEQFQNENFYTIDWVDVATCVEMGKFADNINKKYNCLLSVPFLLLAGMDFMSERMECNSCPVREEYFNEFEQFLTRKAKDYGYEK